MAATMSRHVGPNPARSPKPCMSHDAANPRAQLVGGPLDQCTAVITPAMEAAGAWPAAGGFYVRDGFVWSWCATTDRSKR
jgi:hypothetical protein